MKPELNVHLYVIPVCNLKCKHCYYKSINGDVPENLLSIKEISQIISFLCDSCETDLHMEGGEIFLRHDIGQLFEELSEKYWNHITITTNGTIRPNFDHSYLRKLAKLRVSVCGHTDEMQKELRRIPLKPVLDNLLFFRSENIPVTLRITLHKKNYKAVLKESIDFYRDKGFLNFDLFEFQVSGRGKEYAREYSLEDDDVEAILQQLDSVGGLGGIRVNLGPRRVPLVLKNRDFLESRGFKVRELNPVNSLTIDYDGRMGICPWNIGGSDIGVLDVKHLHESIYEKIIKGELIHSCNICSSITIEK